jgi:radical SAM protein with 4Fe4S-binding SPASM domain
MPKQLIKRALGTVRIGRNAVVLDSALRVVRAYRNAYRKWRSDPKILARMQELVAERPLDINIETSNFCAASCVFCPNSKAKRIKSNMDMTLFQKICDEYALMGGGALAISSMQSDLFSDKMLLDRLRYLQRFKGTFYIYATTFLVGASKLDDAELEFLLRVFDHLEISLGGPDKDNYRRMFGINAFDTVRAQLLRVKKLVEAKQLKVRLSLYFRTSNPKGILSSDLVRELGNTFSIANVLDSFFSWGGIIQQKDLPEGAKLLTADNSTRRSDCAVPSSSMSINVDGSVVGCGCVDWNSRHVVGNVSLHSLKEVWQSKQALEFRHAFSRNQVPGLCKDCSIYTPVEDAFSVPRLKDYNPIYGLYNEFN